MAYSCIGSGRYTAQIRHMSGGIIEEIDASEILEGSWSRLVHGTSGAHISVPLGGSMNGACCKYVDLGKGLPAYEMWLWRDVNGENQELVWLGVITDISIGEGNIVSIDASDHSWWLSVRLLNDQTHEAQDVNSIANDLVSFGYTVNNPGNVKVIWEPLTITGTKSPKAVDGTHVLDAVTDVLRGVSYWTCNLKQFRIGMTSYINWTFTDDDLPETPPLSWSVDDFATRVFARTSDTVFGSAGGINTSTYGIPIFVEKVIDASASTIAEADAFAAKRLTEVSTTGPRLEALHSSLSPQSGVVLNELWPGCKVNVLFDAYCDPVQRELYLTQVECAWNAEDEDIRIELSPNLGDASDPRVSAA